MDELNINNGIEPQETREEPAIPSEVSAAPEEASVAEISEQIVTENRASETPEAPEKLKAPKKPKAPKGKKSVANIVSTILIVAIIAVGLIVLSVSFISYVMDVRGYERALATYIDVISNEDSGDIGKLVPNADVQVIVEADNDGKQEHIEYLIDNAVEQEVTNDEIDEIQYNILSAEALDESKCAEIGTELEEKYNLSPDCVEKAYKIKFDYRFKEDRSEYYGKRRCYAVRIDGEWYLVTTSCEFADFSD